MTIISSTEKRHLSFGFSDYPKKRDDYILPSAIDWLEIKQANDQVQGPNNGNWWRIHDKLYDLTSFKHPGGQSVIEMTMNTDITELYESNHIHIDKAEQLLKKYFIRDCDRINEPRYVASYFCTFHKDGFYCTLRNKVSSFFNSVEGKQLIDEKKRQYLQRTELIHDALLVLFLSGWTYLISYFDSYSFSDIRFIIGIMLTGFVFGLLAICSHNFYHQRETPYNTSITKNSTCLLSSYNWRQYSFDLTGQSSYEWKVSHVYSHHIFPNTILDYEVIAFEPLLSYLPYSFKSLASYLKQVSSSENQNKYQHILLGIIFQVFSSIGGILFFLGVFPLVMIVPAVKRFLFIFIGKRRFRWEFMLPIYLFIMLCVGRVWCRGQTFRIESLITAANDLWIPYLIVNCVCSLSFLHISLAAGHHHPLSWHAGDNTVYSTPPLHEKNKNDHQQQKSNSEVILSYRDSPLEDVDFGIFQLLAVLPRPEIDRSTLLSSMSFGQHILHHLFPAIDQCLLVSIEGILYQTCEDFQIAELVPHLHPQYRKKLSAYPQKLTWGESRLIDFWKGWTGMVFEIFRSEVHPSNFPDDLLRKYNAYVKQRKSK